MEIPLHSWLQVSDKKWVTEEESPTGGPVGTVAAVSDLSGRSVDGLMYQLSLEGRPVLLYLTLEEAMLAAGKRHIG